MLSRERKYITYFPLKVMAKNLYMYIKFPTLNTHFLAHVSPWCRQLSSPLSFAIWNLDNFSVCLIHFHLGVLRLKKVIVCEGKNDEETFRQLFMFDLSFTTRKENESQHEKEVKQLINGSVYNGSFFSATTIYNLQG